MKLKDLNVLIIDDVETVRKALSKSLNELGIVNINQSYSLLSLWNAIVDYFESHTPIDIVFFEWNMPKGNVIYKHFSRDFIESLLLSNFIV
jgi:CheY-like chemotaxis protein